MALMRFSVLIPAGSVLGVTRPLEWLVLACGGFSGGTVSALPMCSTVPLIASSSSLGRVRLLVSEDGTQEGARPGGFSLQAWHKALCVDRVTERRQHLRAHHATTRRPIQIPTSAMVRLEEAGVCRAPAQCHGGVGALNGDGRRGCHGDCERRSCEFSFSA